MAYLNANIPVMYSQIKREYLYDLKDHHGEVEDCIIFGLASITGEEQAKKIIEIMENAVTLEVPNKVDYEFGSNWGDIYE